MKVIPVLFLDPLNVIYLRTLSKSDLESNLYKFYQRPRVHHGQWFKYRTTLFYIKFSIRCYYFNLASWTWTWIVVRVAARGLWRHYYWNFDKTSSMCQWVSETQCQPSHWVCVTVRISHHSDARVKVCHSVCQSRCHGTPKTWKCLSGMMCAIF